MPGSRLIALSASTIPSAARGPYQGFRNEDARGREARVDGRDHVLSRGRVGPGDEPDPARKTGQRALVGGVEEPFVGELLFQPLDRGQMRTESEALERECAQPELAFRREELGTPEHVDALALREVELQRVERPPGDRGGQARAVGRILEREENAAPALRPAQLRHLALDPQRRQPLEPVGDAAVEAGDGVDLPVAVEQWFDLHPGRA